MTPDTAMNELVHEHLTVTGENVSAQMRDYSDGTMMAIYIPEDAPRGTENGRPFHLAVADCVLLRDLLNAATDRGWLSQ